MHKETLIDSVSALAETIRASQENSLHFPVDMLQLYYQ